MFIQKEDVLATMAGVGSHSRFRSAPEAMIGGLISLLETRFGLARRFVLVAKSAEPVLGHPEFRAEFIRRCEMAKKIVVGKSVVFWANPLPDQCKDVAPQLIVYADAGYNALSRSSSVGSIYICFGVPTSRGGIIKLAAHPIACKSRK